MIVIDNLLAASQPQHDVLDVKFLTGSGNATETRARVDGKAHERTTRFEDRHDFSHESPGICDVLEHHLTIGQIDGALGNIRIFERCFPDTVEAAGRDHFRVGLNSPVCSDAAGDFELRSLILNDPLTAANVENGAVGLEGIDFEMELFEE